MADTAAHLCDEVLPHVPIRQWVISFPFRIRYLLAFDPKLCAAVRRVFVRMIQGFLRERAESVGLQHSRSGAVVLAQRFGGSIQLNLHFHALLIDGADSSPSPLAPPIFHEAAALTDRDLVLVTTALQCRILRCLRRLGRLPRVEHDDAAQPEPDEPLFAEPCAASVQSRVALGTRTGAAVEELGRRRHDERPLFLPGELCCDLERFFLHAKVPIAADDRDWLERVCRYSARPPLQVARLSLAPDGKLICALRWHWRDGTSAMAFEPLDFLSRLAALVPRPRAHRLTYHGVLAPAAE